MLATSLQEASSILAELGTGRNVLVYTVHPGLSSVIFGYRKYTLNFFFEFNKYIMTDITEKLAIFWVLVIFYIVLF